MAASLAPVCFNCGQPESDAPTCTICGATLLVGLHAVAAPERVRYLVARALTELGPPSPSLGALKRPLALPGALVMGPLARTFAREALEVASVSGMDLEVRPAALGSATSTPMLRPAFVVALLVAVAGLVAIQVHRARKAEAAALVTDSAELEPSVAPADDPAAKPLELPTTTIGAVALDSVAALECPDSEGAGFFIDKETLVTNAHVLCRDGSSLKVHLHDGRDLIGVTVEKNLAQDWARVNVLGAAARPLPIGDPTLLEPGEKAVIIGSPHGLAFTLHEGEISYVGRDVLGVGFIQINATINPGNSGGPLLDSQGRVVGIVTLKMNDAEGIGMALPIDYVTLPNDTATLARWSALLNRVEAQDAKEVARFRSDADRPLLVGVADEGRIALVLQHSRTAPGSTSLTLDLDDGAGTTCPVTARVERWMPFAEAVRNEVDSPRLRWLVGRAAGNEMFVGAGVVEPGDCLRRMDSHREMGQLVLRREGEIRGKVPVRLRALAAGGRR